MTTEDARIDVTSPTGQVGKIDTASDTIGTLQMTNNLLRARVADYETVLQEIAWNKYCNYDGASNTPYDTGVVDGHRYCAKLCRDVLSQHGIGGTVK